MTMQVGLVSRKAKTIVLASDKKWTHPPKNLDLAAKRYSSKRPKIEFNDTLAVCMAGDMALAQQIADLIFNQWHSTDNDHPEEALERIAERIALQDREGAQCHVVVRSPYPRLFTFEFTDFGGNSVPSSNEELGKFIAGDAANAGTYWAECFEREQQSLSVRELTYLATHTVLASGKINPDGIGGLDIVICTAEGFQRLSDSDIAELERKFEENESKIKKIVFDNGGMQ